MPPKGRPSKTQTVDRKRMSDATTDHGSEGRDPPTVAGPGRIRAPGTRKEDWIAIGLRRVYAGAVEEAIPQQMLELLSALDDEDEPREGNDG